MGAGSFSRDPTTVPRASASSPDICPEHIWHGLSCPGALQQGSVPQPSPGVQGGGEGALVGRLSPRWDPRAWYSQQQGALPWGAWGGAACEVRQAWPDSASRKALQQKWRIMLDVIQWHFPEEPWLHAALSHSQPLPSVNCGTKQPGTLSLSLYHTESGPEMRGRAKHQFGNSF